MLRRTQWVNRAGGKVEQRSLRSVAPRANTAPEKAGPLQSRWPGVVLARAQTPRQKERGRFGRDNSAVRLGAYSVANREISVPDALATRARRWGGAGLDCAEVGAGATHTEV